MRRVAVLALFLGASLSGAPQTGNPQAPSPAAYAPDLKRWRMEVSPALGGWSSESAVRLQIKLVDPADPTPPQDEPQPKSFDDYEGEGGDDSGASDTGTAEELRQARLQQEAEVARQQWRQRQLKLWFNGVAMVRDARVGITLYLDLTAQNGENRLEIQEPDSGLKVVRSWWVSTGRTRLRVVSTQVQDEYASGGLQVLV